MKVEQRRVMVPSRRLVTMTACDWEWSRWTGDGLGESGQARDGERNGRDKWREGWRWWDAGNDGGMFLAIEDGCEGWE